MHKIKALRDKILDWHKTKSILTASEICQFLYDKITKGDTMSIDTQEQEIYERRAPKQAQESDVESE